MEKQIYCWGNSTEAGSATVGTCLRFDSDLHHLYGRAHGCSKTEQQIHDLAQLFIWEKQLTGAAPSHPHYAERSCRAGDGCARPVCSPGTERSRRREQKLGQKSYLGYRASQFIQ